MLYRRACCLLLGSYDAHPDESEHCRHVSSALRSLMKGVQANGEAVDADNIVDIVCPRTRVCGTCTHPVRSGGESAG